MALEQFYGCPSHFKVMQDIYIKQTARINTWVCEPCAIFMGYIVGGVFNTALPATQMFVQKLIQINKQKSKLYINSPLWG